MRTLSTFSILFWIYTKRAKNDLAVIYARITVNGRKLNISLKRKVDVKLWNPQTQKVRGKRAQSKEINEFLAQEHSRFYQIYQELKIQGKLLSPEGIKEKYFGKEEKLFSVEDIIDYHNQNCFPKLRGNTSRLYITSQKYIREFIKKAYKRKDLYLQELDYSFILKFEKFLRAKKPKHYQKNLQHNAVMKHIQRLRRMVTLSFHLGWIERDPFIKFRPNLIQKERESLTEEELHRIEGLQNLDDRLRAVRDMFVFSCYTGISYADLMVLTPRHLVMGINRKIWIITQREKNGNPLKIPLLSKAIDLIDLYKENYKCLVNNSLFPKISNQKMNSYLKEIAAASHIQKNVTFHLGRHTFATTIALTNGVPIETVSKILGHKKLVTTQIYAKVIERKVSEDMELLQEKMSKIDAMNSINRKKAQ